jgi:hypothetical protein
LACYKSRILEADPLSFTWGKKVKNQKESDWEQASYSRDKNLFDSGAIRIALLFGSAALAFTMILAPIVDRGAGNFVSKRGVSSGLDGTATGSILKPRGYTVRRSVLHSAPSSVCIINENGSQSGKC